MSSDSRFQTVPTDAIVLAIEVVIMMHCVGRQSNQTRSDISEPIEYINHKEVSIFDDFSRHFQLVSIELDVVLNCGGLVAEKKEVASRHKNERA
jgi:hypothetical protein